MTGVSLDRGVERIAEAFERARADGRRAALMPYMMAGYPTVDASAEIAQAYVDGGADLIELGIPSRIRSPTGPSSMPPPSRRSSPAPAWPTAWGWRAWSRTASRSWPCVT